MRIPLSTGAARMAIACALTIASGPRAFAAPDSPPTAPGASPDAHAEATVKAMHPDEKTILTHGVFAMGLGGPAPGLPADAVPGAGYVPGIARLGVPSLRESDASLGVAWVMGLRHDGATALPSGLAQASSWNPDLLYGSGAIIGGEAKAKGFNVLLAGGTNLMRDPRNGRTFEYLSEDPWLSGTLVGAAISGIQSNHIIATIKHFALNDQETARTFVDVHVDEAAARESDLLAFEIGIERGHPGSVMCAYNLVNGHHACDSDWLLNTVLKHDWRYPGFVMSDWGAVPTFSAAANGLDQQSGAQLDPKVWLGAPLAEAARKDAAMAARLDDMNRRVLNAIYANHLDSDPAVPGGKIDFAANGAIALEAAKQGIVLLRNEGGILPLAKTAGRIAVIGGYASSGTISGGGSSQVDGPEGPAIRIPVGGDNPFAAYIQQHYQNSAPLKAIRALAPHATVTYRDGNYIADAVNQAKQADVAIVFATKWSTEGVDLPDLSLPHGQDALIAAVAAANPHTIVVLETGNPVAMPWIGQTAAVIEAWYPGARGGEAIASVLFGETNPSGHLPVSFPASIAQLPHAETAGYSQLEPNFAGLPPAGVPVPRIVSDFNVEGSDVGYRWYARKGEAPLFAFGYGLSYTTFASAELAMKGLSAAFSVKNTGARAGATVGQLYLTGRPAGAKLRLVGYRRVELAPGASQKVTLTIDPRLLADWSNNGWSIAAGDYTFALGSDALHLGQPVTVRLRARHWTEPRASGH